MKQRDEAISLKLVFEYDGACFFGCQLQPGQRTVQGEVEVCVSFSISLLKIHHLKKKTPLTNLILSAP
jgi:tRNA U38,U39,U40 pseudouridine synthase TruA